MSNIIPSSYAVLCSSDASQLSSLHQPHIHTRSISERCFFSPHIPLAILKIVLLAYSSGWLYPADYSNRLTSICINRLSPLSPFSFRFTGYDRRNIGHAGFSEVRCYHAGSSVEPSGFEFPLPPLFPLGLLDISEVNIPDAVSELGLTSRMLPLEPGCKSRWISYIIIRIRTLPVRFIQHITSHLQLCCILVCSSL